MANMISEWVRCPVCGNKTGLQTVKTPKKIEMPRKVAEKTEM